MGFVDGLRTRWTRASWIPLLITGLVGGSVLAGCEGRHDGEAGTPSSTETAAESGVGQPFGGPLAPDATLRETLAHPDPLIRVQRVAQILQSATPDQLPEIRAEFERAPEAWGDLEYALFAGWWARFDPTGALAYCDNDIRADHPRVFSEAMRSFARKDPQAAVKSGWLMNVNVNMPGWRTEMLEALVTGWFHSGNPGLEEWLQTEVEPNSQVAALRTYIRLRIVRDGARETLEWSRTAPFPPEHQRLLFANALNAVARMDPPLAIEYLAVAEKDGIDVRSFVARIARGWSHLDPPKAMEWLVATKVDEAERNRAVIDVAQTWLNKDEATFEAWLATHVGEQWTDLLRKQAIFHHVTANKYRVDWLHMMKRASEFADEEERKMEYLWLIQRWRVIDPVPAEAWLAENSKLLGDKLEFANQLYAHDREAIERVLEEEANRSR